MIDPGDLEDYLAQDGRPLGRKGQGWPWVYRNLLSVAETLRWIKERGAITVPDDSRELVERASHADYLRDQAERHGGSWLALWRRLYSGDLLKQQLGEAGLVDWAKTYEQSLVNERVATRLGEGSVVLPVSLISPFDGSTITRMPVPGWWLESVDPGAEASCEGNTIQVADLRMNYDETGLHKEG